MPDVSETDDDKARLHLRKVASGANPAVVVNNASDPLHSAPMPRPGYSPLYQLDFENPVLEIERQIDAIEERPDAARYADELRTLNETRESLLKKLYANLSPWQTVRVARHPLRPQATDYMSMICRDFCELHGDRAFGDDPAIITGFARIGSMKCMFIAHNKGKTVAEKVAAHFGCAHPEGYRKALLKMKLAEKLKLPIVTLVDTPGAYPGVGSEQRGQAQAIALNLLEMSRLRTPIVSVVIGEGGSGGALGIAVADRVAMLENAWYSVISPEGCAAILWKEANEQTNARAAECLALTARRNLENALIDEVIPEPVGGAHRDPRKTADALQTWIVDRLRDLTRMNPETLVRQRYEKFRKMGAFRDEMATVSA
jgi:acetyl-CoA carboxylase carboxyl transferase subunit alpha